MRLVDTHTHAWGPDTAELPWHAPELPPGWSGPYTHDDLLKNMDDVGVDEALLLPTTIYGRDERANEYTIRALEAHPQRLWGIGVLEYFASESVLRERTRRLLAHDRMLGIRFHACFEYGETPGEMDRSADWIAEDALDPLYDELGNHDASVFVLAKPEQYEMLDSLAAAYPDVQFVLEHMGWPDETTAPDEPPWTDIQRLATHDNVLVKVSAVAGIADDDWPYDDAAGYVTQLLSWFGPERLVLGSDYPWLDETATYEQAISWPEQADYLSARDLSYLSHRTFENRLADRSR